MTITTKAQNYVSNVFVESTFGKNDQGIKASSIEARASGVYGWFHYLASRKQPLKKSANPANLEKLTVLSAGYGIHTIFGQDFNFHGGFGPSMAIAPVTNSIPMKNDLYIGGLASAEISSENSGFGAEANVSYMSMMSGSSSDWSKGLFMGELRARKYFGKFLGFGAGYRIESSTTTEKYQQNNPYLNSTYSSTGNELSPFISVGTKMFRLEAGPMFKWTKYSYSYIDAVNGGYMEGWNRNMWPTGFKVRLAFSWENLEK